MSSSCFGPMPMRGGLFAQRIASTHLGCETQLALGDRSFGDRILSFLGDSSFGRWPRASLAAMMHSASLSDASCCRVWPKEAYHVESVCWVNSLRHMCVGLETRRQPVVLAARPRALGVIGSQNRDMHSPPRAFFS